MSSLRLPGLAQGTRTLTVVPGPVLLDRIEEGPGLASHRRRHGQPATLPAPQLLALTEEVGLRGRGGAGFPFATKLAAVLAGRGRPSLVVNLSEGEPASFKDAALALTAPHLVLDGAASVAGTLRVREIHVVVPGDEPVVEAAVRRALAERSREERLAWRVHATEPRFVAGQARAVIELLSGRENAPVTSWQPEAVRGLNNRPTLLSNAETFAQLGVLVLRGREGYTGMGTDHSPGTTLLTLRGDSGAPVVLEVAHGTPWHEVLGADVNRPVLLGGFHGTWTRAGGLVGLTVDRDELAAQGLALGAGVVLPLPDDECPLHRTSGLAAYLAGQSAGRCGPCVNGLPELAASVRELAEGAPARERVTQLVELVVRRGACAHPDGTARLVTSLLDAFPDEPGLHAAGRCSFSGAARSTRTPGPRPAEAVR